MEKHDQTNLCTTHDCLYNSVGHCTSCSDLYDPSKGEECLDYIKVTYSSNKKHSEGDDEYSEPRMWLKSNPYIE